MFKIIVEKEIRDLIGSTKFILTFAACAFLIIITFYVGAARFKLDKSYFEASRAENLRTTESLKDWNELDETRIFLPPRPLESLVSGVSNDIGRTAIIRGRGDITTEDSRYNEDPIFAIFRFLDLEFIFKVLLSLFAVLLGYDSISGEKERGTLRLSFANAVPRQTYIIGKLAGSFAALTVSILIAIAIGVLILPMMGISLTADEWIKLSLIIMAGLLYAGVFLTLSIFISSLTCRTANSFLILLVIWVMCIHIIPGVSVLMAGRSVDVPSSDEIMHKKSSLSAQLLNEFDEGMRSFTYNNPDSGPEALSKSLNSHLDSLNEVRDTKLQSFSARLEEDRNNRQKLQERFAFSLARLSPVTSLTLATSYLAGTSLGLKNYFADGARNYQTQFGDFIKEKTGRNLGGGLKLRTSSTCSGDAGSNDDDDKPAEIDPGELPNFNYSDYSLSESIHAAATDIGILMFFNLIFFAGACVAFTRYDVR